MYVYIAFDNTSTDFPDSVLSKKQSSQPLALQVERNVSRAHRYIIDKVFTSHKSDHRVCIDKDDWSLHQRHLYDQDAINYY